MAYAVGHISGCHLNPARSTGPAIFEGGIALQQLWFFWVMPVIGALLAGFAYKWLGKEGK
jgi:aquaporin Z